MLCSIVTIPAGAGAGNPGCAQGPAALLEAGLPLALRRAGYAVALSELPVPEALAVPPHPNAAIRNLAVVAGWVRAASDAAFAVSRDGVPVFLGGDHSVSAGTVSGLARRAALAGRPLFVLWLDAHADFHRLDTTETGNLHGVPLAYLAGEAGFTAHFPPLAAAVDPARICLLGLRSVDPAEIAGLARAGVEAHAMADLHRHGFAAPLHAFLHRVRAEGGLLHVSLDADVLDPGVAPGVGTPEPGGASLAEAREAMAILNGSGLVTSLDLVEVNPALDVDGRTARAMVELAAILVDHPRATRVA